MVSGDKENCGGRNNRCSICEKASDFVFIYEGEEFIIWSWKGDYMNLGAGAETGIYQVKDGEIDEYGNYIMENGEYSYLYAEVNREYSVDMTLELYHDSNGGWNLQ